MKLPLDCQIFKVLQTYVNKRWKDIEQAIVRQQAVQ